jgi:hypothetical protein
MQFRTFTKIILIVLTILSIMYCEGADEQQPEPTMFLYGYVFINGSSGENVTAAPEGLQVYAKVNDTTVSNATTQMEGRYTLPIKGIEVGTLVKVFVQSLQAATIRYYDWNVTWLDLIVNDLHPPDIEPLSPTPGAVLLQLPIWVNVTLYDDVAINETATRIRLNETAVANLYGLTCGSLECKIETAIPGLYVLDVTAADLSGNTATKAWNFTFLTPEPPSIDILYPTTENPAYIHSGEKVSVVFNYTEKYPTNATIDVYNVNQTIGQLPVSLIGGNNEQINLNITTDKSGSDGKYTISITMFNVFNLSQTVEKTEAIIIDDTPPTIWQVSQDPLAENVQPIDAVKVNATIADSLSGVLNATLLWRIENGVWNIVLMQRITEDIYTGEIPPLQNYTTVHFKIEAFDMIGNNATEDESGLFYTYRVVPEYPTMILLSILLALFSLVVLLPRINKPKYCRFLRI